MDKQLFKKTNRTAYQQQGSWLGGWSWRAVEFKRTKAEWKLPTTNIL